MSVNAITIADLVKSFVLPDGRKLTAVNHTSWSVAQGEVLAFLGKNGAGKSTTIDMILGLTNPTSGEVRVLGDDPAKAIRAGRLGGVLQSGSLLEDAKVGELLTMVASTFGHQKRVPELIRDWDLEEIKNSYVKKCSGGQQQRLRFALGLVSDPEILVLDEPTTGLDVEARHKFWTLMHREAERGRTILFATHYLEEAENFADRVVIIDQGRIIADGSVAQIQASLTGATIVADLSAADPSQIERITSELRDMEIVSAVALQGSKVSVKAHNSDQVARWLFNNTAARNLLISTTTLEEAFCAITADEPDGDGLDPVSDSALTGEKA